MKITKKYLLTNALNHNSLYRNCYLLGGEPALCLGFVSTDLNCEIAEYIELTISTHRIRRKNAIKLDIRGTDYNHLSIGDKQFRKKHQVYYEVVYSELVALIKEYRGKLTHIYIHAQPTTV